MSDVLSLTTTSNSLYQSLREKMVLVIYNPVSGMFQNHSYLFDLAEALSKEGFASLVKMTGGKGDATAIVQEFADAVSTVIVCGGDGTLHEVIYGMRQANIDLPIGYIPLGTTNDFAVNYNIPSEFHRAVDEILDGDTVRIDIGRINGDDTFNYILCFGVFTKTSYETSQALKNVLGYMAYLLQGALEIADIGNPTHMIVEADDGTIYEGDYIFGGVVNSYTVAHFFKLPQELVDLTDGQFEVLLVRQPQNIIEAHLIAQSLFNNQYDNPNIDFFHTKSVRFHSDTPVKWCADGEYAGSFEDVSAENEQQAIQLIVNSFKK